MSDNRFTDTIRLAIESLQSSADGNTIIGEAIITNSGTTIIPVSKVSIGFANGGLEYQGKNRENSKPSNLNFGGGGGAGVSVSPIAFLIVSASGNVELLNVNASNDVKDPVSSVIGAVERSPELIEKFKEVFKKDKK